MTTTTASPSPQRLRKRDYVMKEVQASMHDISSRVVQIEQDIGVKIAENEMVTTNVANAERYLFSFFF